MHTVGRLFLILAALYLATFVVYRATTKSKSPFVRERTENLSLEDGDDEEDSPLPQFAFKTPDLVRKECEISTPDNVESCIEFVTKRMAGPGEPNREVPVRFPVMSESEIRGSCTKTTPHDVEGCVRYVIERMDPSMPRPSNKPKDVSQ